MKNLFAIIAAVFGGLILSLSLAVIFLLYDNKKLGSAFFIAAGAFFLAFSVLAITGLIKPNSKSDTNDLNVKKIEKKNRDRE